MHNKHKIILDLCGGSGSWSNPYKEAGYDVRLITWPEYDVRQYTPPKNVYGILAAPPCTMFSKARTTARTPRNIREGMECVEACLQIIWSCFYDYKDGSGRPLKFWALENPKGLLQWLLGNPPYKFQPYNFGDRYTKLTYLWGYFNRPKLSPIILTKEEKLKRSSNRTLSDFPDFPDFPNIKTISGRRAITPPGFANAFFKANR